MCVSSTLSTTLEPMRFFLPFELLIRSAYVFLLSLKSAL
jgi:hypothetical protein